MKNRLKLISLLILAAMMLSFAACGGGSDNGKTVNNANETETAVAETTTSEYEARLALPDNLPEADYDGYTFKMAGRTRDDFVQEIQAELEKPATLSNAIYRRNQT